MAMIVMTTRSSIIVKARRAIFDFGFWIFDWRKPASRPRAGGEAVFFVSPKSQIQNPKCFRMFVNPKSKIRNPKYFAFMARRRGLSRPPLKLVRWSDRWNRGGRTVDSRIQSSPMKVRQVVEGVGIRH